MSDRVHAITVVLEAGVREDDAAPILDAIRQIRGVESVTAAPVDALDLHIATSRVRSAISARLWNALDAPLTLEDE